MITIQQLKEAGAVDSTLALVETDGLQLLTLDDLASMSFEEIQNLKDPVVIEGATEVATARAIPTALAKAVYSCNGELIGKWSPESLTFRILTLKQGRLQLVTSKQFKERSRQMANLKAMVQGAQQIATETQPKETTAFDPNGVDASTENSAEQAAKEQKKREAQEKKDRQRRRLNEIQQMNEGIKLADTVAVTEFNFHYGRLMFHVTASDDTVRVTTKKVPKVNEKGQNIPNETFHQSAPDGVRKKYQENGQITSTKYCETEYSVKPVHCKPSTIKGEFFRMRSAGYFPITQITSQDTIGFDKNNKDEIIFSASKEAAILVIQALFDGQIMEDENLIQNPTTVKTVSSICTPKSKDKDKVSDTGAVNTDEVIRTRLTIVKTNGRSSLLTMDNFFPLKLYQTVSASQITSDEIESDLNLSVRKAMDGKSYEDLTDAAKAIITENNGVYTAKWFSQKNAVVEDIKRFDDKDAPLAVVKYPILKVTESKSGAKPKIAYQYYDLDDEEHGPLSDPRFIRLFEATKLDKDTFKTELNKMKTRTSKGGDNGNIVSNRVALACAYGAQLGKNTVYQGMSIKDLQNCISYQANI